MDINEKKKNRLRFLMKQRNNCRKTSWNLLKAEMLTVHAIAG